MTTTSFEWEWNRVVFFKDPLLQKDMELIHTLFCFIINLSLHYLHSVICATCGKNRLIVQEGKGSDIAVMCILHDMS